MRDEVKVQSAMVDEITNKVDAASSHLNTMNRKMKQTLAQTRSADRSAHARPHAALPNA